MNREVGSNARAARDSTNTSPSSHDIQGGVHITDRKLSPDDSPSSNRELKRGDRHSGSDLEDYKQEPLKDMPDWPKITSKESVGSVSSFLDSALSTVSDGYFSESFRDSLAPRNESQFASLSSSAMVLPSRVVALNDTSDSPAAARNESVDSVSSFVDSALSTMSDDHHSFSDSLKESSPETAFQAVRSASCDNLLNMGRFSAPVDRSPARPRRLSEPVLPVQFDFDVPMIRRSYNTENMFRFEGTSTPRASNIQEFQIRDLEVEGMILRCLSVHDDSDSHSDLTRSDGEGGKKASTKDRVAALIRSRDGSSKPGQKDASPQRPRRRRRQKDLKEPDPDSTTPSPPDNAISPATARGRFPNEWRDERRAHKAELRWSVTSAPRWRAHSSDEILQTPFRRRRELRDVASETDTLSLNPLGTLVAKKRGALKAEESFVSPPLKASGSDTDKPTPSTVGPTPSPSETEAGTGTLRENFHSLDFPPPL